MVSEVGTLGVFFEILATLYLSYYRVVFGNFGAVNPLPLGTCELQINFTKLASLGEAKSTPDDVMLDSTKPASLGEVKSQSSEASIS